METKLKKDRRKVLLFIPLLVVPFIAFVFYAMGGGSGQSRPAQSNSGINTNLPDASFSTDTPKTKADYYQQADHNSPRQENGIAKIAGQLGFDMGGKYGTVTEHDQTRQINEKLEILNKEINKPTEPIVHTTPTSTRTPQVGMKSDVDRLEALMKTMQENKGEDPEMAQLNGLMQNILDLQHPELVQQRYQKQRNISPDSQFRAIPAVIVNNQKAVQGATIKLRLQDSIRLNGVFIPKGHELFGTCRITNQRLLLDIRNIRMGTSIVPVDLSVYSLDGMEGIYAPEAMLSDAFNSGTDNAVRGVSLIGLDGSLATQVAGAGIDAAKNLVSKKVRKIKVKLQAGHSVLLRNNSIR